MRFDVSLRVECEACALQIMLDIVRRYRDLLSVTLADADAPAGHFKAMLSAQITSWPGSRPCVEHGDVVKTRDKGG